MSNVRRLLSVLQNSDSFFPSGSMSFSWGLEALCATSRIDGAMSLREFVVGQVRHRWSTFDRVVLAHAHNVRHGDLDSLAELDCLVEAQSLVDELGEGSRRNGQALLTVHDKLGTDGAGDYRRRILAGEAHGHLPVMQGFLWGTMGLGRDECQTRRSAQFYAGS